MRLTLQTDYALRTLLYLAAVPERRATIDEIADTYRISRHHLVKVVRRLHEGGWIETTRGRGGGLKLARAPERIRVGEIVRATEPGLHLLDCMNPGAPQELSCPLALDCMLKGILARALGAFLAELDRTTLAELAARTPMPGRL